jgi:hypothetical protein
VTREFSVCGAQARQAYCAFSDVVPARDDRYSTASALFERRLIGDLVDMAD